MKINEIIDLIQLNDPEYVDDDFGTVIPKKVVIASGIPASVGSMQTDQKLLMNQDTQWQPRFRVLHKIFELKDLPVDMVRFHSTGKEYYVNENNTTGTNQTVSFLVEYRDYRRTKEDAPVWEEYV